MCYNRERSALNNISFGGNILLDNNAKIFLKVALKKSITSAARDLFMSQPAVSLSVKKLEKQLGAKLLYRKPKGIELTPAGNKVANYLKKADELYTEAKNELLNTEQSSGKYIRIGANSIFGDYILPKIIAEYVNKYPGNMFSVYTAGNNKTILKMLESKVIDIGFTVGDTDSNSTITSEKIAEDELILITSPDNPLSKHDYVTKDELLKENFVITKKGSKTFNLENSLKKMQIDFHDINIVAELQTYEAMKAAVEDCLGIAFLSSIVVSKELHLNLLKKLPIANFEMTRNIYVNYLKYDELSIFTKRFVELSINCIAKKLNNKI